MDSFAANYIKPRTSNLTNMNSSVITNKRQAQTIFTGYSRQITSINQGCYNQGPIVFNGTDGLAINNLKNGNTWTPPQTLNAIQTTHYCESNNTSSNDIIPTYNIICSDVLGIQYITLDIIGPFYISYDPYSSTTGVVEFFFYESATNLSPIGIQVLPLNSSLLVTPVNGTGWNNIGYVFRCTPLTILYSDGLSSALEVGYSYQFTNNSGTGNKTLTLTKQDMTTLIIIINDNDTYIPSPSYGFILYTFS